MRYKAFFLGASVLTLLGCNLFTPKPAPALAAKSIAAPYEGLVDKSVAVVIFAPAVIIDQYPGAREEIADFVTTKMREQMASTRLVLPREIIYWQNDTLNWTNLPPRDIGRHFGVDRVLFIEVLDYSMRRPVGVSNLQGRLRAQCHIYDTEPKAAGPDENGRMAAVWTGLIDAVWPPAKPLDPTQTNEAAVRLRTLESFADMLVRNFHAEQASPARRG
jgi:hypothetical protein